MSGRTTANLRIRRRKRANALFPCVVKGALIYHINEVCAVRRRTGGLADGFLLLPEQRWGASPLPKPHTPNSGKQYPHTWILLAAIFMGESTERCNQIMAIYHCSIKIISRGKGKSAVAAAAYRAGEKITNDYDGITHDYTRKGGVVHTEILLPEHAPEEYADRAILWNAVEKIEKAKNSQLAREVELALPVELSQEQNISLVCEYVKNNFVDSGMCADICVHNKNDGNPHAHIMLTMRPFNKDKSWGDKQKKEYILDKSGDKIYDPKKRQYKCKSIPTTDWNDQTKAEEWRVAWADCVNAVLEQQGVEQRVDHRSYERQRENGNGIAVEQIPTVHMGVAATQMERRGIVTERGNMNRVIAGINEKLRQLWDKIIQLKDKLKEAIVPTAPPTLASVLKGIIKSGEQDSHYGKIRDLKMAVRVYNFMQENDISTLPELREMVSDTLTKYDNACDNLKFYDGRVKTLDEHIKQGSIYLKHSDLYAEYQKLRPRKQPKFYEAHRADLMMFEAAQRYFKEHYFKSVSLDAWKTERGELTAGRGKAYRDYNAFRTRFLEADIVCRAAEQIIREVNAPEHKRDTRNRGWER